MLAYANKDGLGVKYSERLLTPKDFMTHFKLILHRALYTRHINPDHTSRLATNCRLCHAATERIGHLPNCSALQPIFKSFLSLAGCNPTDPLEHSRLILLGLTSPPLPQALSDLHLIMWKFILIHFTLVDLEHKPFKPRDVWLGAVRRYASKANKLTYKIRVKQARAEATFSTLDVRAESHLLSPLATIGDGGIIEWTSPFCRDVDEA